MTVPFEYRHFETDNVLVQDLTDWGGETEGMNEVERDWLRRARRAHITASVTEFGSDMQLGPDVQDHLAREWTEKAEQADIEKIAFVSDGIEARAVSANLDVSQQIQTFQSIEHAVQWARE